MWVRDVFLRTLTKKGFHGGETVPEGWRHGGGTVSIRCRDGIDTVPRRYRHGPRGVSKRWGDHFDTVPRRYRHCLGTVSTRWGDRFDTVRGRCRHPSVDGVVAQVRGGAHPSAERLSSTWTTEGDLPSRSRLPRPSTPMTRAPSLPPCGARRYPSPARGDRPAGVRYEHPRRRGRSRRETIAAEREQ